MNILGYCDFVDIFWGHHNIGLYLGGIYMHFYKVKVQNGEYFLVAKFFWDA